MKKRSRTYLTMAAIAVLIGVLVTLFRAFPSSSPAIVQPIKFSHKIHIEMASLTCTDCHVNVERLPVATIPNLELCQTCHSDEPLSESPEEKVLLQYVSDQQEIPWIRGSAVPDHVYFSHRRHVTVGGLDCVSCHGAVAEMMSPVSKSGGSMTMSTCMNCHTERKVTNDCLACHR